MKAEVLTKIGRANVRKVPAGWVVGEVVDGETVTLTGNRDDAWVRCSSTKGLLTICDVIFWW